jgi:hypothetical protein
VSEYYWVCGVNSMGSTLYVGSKDASSATLWSGAPKEMRCKFSKCDALEMKNRLDKTFEFASTRHYIEEVIP